MCIYIFMLWISNRYITKSHTLLHANIHYLHEDKFIVRNKSFNSNNGDDHRFPKTEEDFEFEIECCKNVKKYEFLNLLLNNDNNFTKINNMRLYSYLLESTITMNLTSGGLFDDYYFRID